MMKRMVSLVTPALLHASMDECWPSFEFDEIIILSIEIQNLASIHPLPMSIIQQIQRCFLQASNDQKYHNKWYSDDAWRKIVENDFGLKDITKQNINKALLSTTLCHPLKLHDNKRRITTEENKSFKGYFYLIANEFTTKEILSVKLDWNLIYFNYRLPRSKKRKANNNESKC